ncbi:Heterogeneous nuclear ribonucleoprotein K homolog, partial [Anthophora quadrimaculata]
MKREADAGAMTGSGGPTSPHKRYRQGDDELRLLIPSKVAGSIIGKGGQNITKLRSQYKASIIVPDCPGPERLLYESWSNCWSVFDSRVLTISSDLSTVLQVLNEVVPNLEENGSRHGSDEIDVRMLVHQSQAGCIIGKGGLKIKELREVSHETVVISLALDHRFYNCHVRVCAKASMRRVSDEFNHPRGSCLFLTHRNMQGRYTYLKKLEEEIKQFLLLFRIMVGVTIKVLLRGSTSVTSGSLSSSTFSGGCSLRRAADTCGKPHILPILTAICLVSGRPMNGSVQPPSSFEPPRPFYT